MGSSGDDSFPENSQKIIHWRKKKAQCKENKIGSGKKASFVAPEGIYEGMAKQVYEK